MFSTSQPTLSPIDSRLETLLNKMSLEEEADGRLLGACDSEPDFTNDPVFRARIIGGTVSF